MPHTPQRVVQVVPYDPHWPLLFEEAAQGLRRLFGRELVQIVHIGSTAVPGLAAKPIIDMLMGVRDITRIDAFHPAMEEAGYTPMGENGIPGRRFFVRELALCNTIIRTHHLHIFQQNSKDYARHVQFRDYLRAHPAEAARYGRLKQVLADRFPCDIDAYMDGKDPLVRELEQKAAAWSTPFP